jgi:IS30 family transposase
MAKQKYRQLQPIERMRIEIWKSENVSAQEMGRRLGRSTSTITREVKRNTCQANDYQAHGAQWRHSCRRTAAKPKPKLHPDGVLWGVVCELLRWKWSPQEIAATLKRAYPQQSQHHVSHETIYSAIYAYPKGELRKELIACLRQNRTKRMPRSRGQDRRGRIAEMVSIHVRPPEVDDRIMPGHWEGDLIKGAGNKSAVAVLVERVSRASLH